MKRNLLSILILTGLSPSVASASDRQRIDQLEREVSQLRHQVSELNRRVVRLGGKPMPTRSTTASNSGSGSYRVQRGDSLWSIARKQGTTVARLEALNPGLNPRRMSIGKTLRVPGNSSPASRSSSPSASSQAGNYTIKSGDILGGIASRYGISLKSLLESNPGLNPRRLKIGKKIFIPGTTKARTSTPVVAEKKPTHRPSPPKAEPPLMTAAPAIPRRPQLVVISENRRLDEIAQFYRTDVATINELNHVSLSPAQIIKTGSQIYVPKR